MVPFGACRGLFWLILVLIRREQRKNRSLIETKATMSTAKEKIEALAKMMGASYTDTVIFLEHVALWMSSGLSQEDAVKMHLKTMQEGCAIALGKV
jgi:hypothetical protein